MLVLGGGLFLMSEVPSRLIQFEENRIVSKLVAPGLETKGVRLDCNQPHLHFSNPSNRSTCSNQGKIDCNTFLEININGIARPSRRRMHESHLSSVSY